MPEDAPTASRELVLLGVIDGPHGVNGQVKLRSFTGEPANLLAYGPLRDRAGQRRFELTLTGRARGRLIATVAGVHDREAARALAGVELFVPRAALPEAGADEFYHADLIGLRVERADASAIGRVKAMHDFGAGAVVEIEPEGGGETILLPFTKAAVPLVDLAGGRLVVEPPGEIEAAPSEWDEP